MLASYAEALGPVSAPAFLRLYLCFAAGYLLSYVYRNINAVISPELTSSLGISASSLGFLTSAYFVAFAATQIPAGMLLDRYGPRRVEPVLLSVAGCGALVFAASDSVGGLTFSRALIGVGVGVCLMAPLKAIAAWYPVECHASLSGWMMVAGGAGALLSTAPVAAALPFISWRGIFVVLAALTFVAGAAIFLLVPDTPQSPGAAGWTAQWHGVRTVFGSRRLWWMAPLGSVTIGSFMAIQGLWSVPWLIEVNGYTRDVAAAHLLLMGIAIIGGYLCIGVFATRLERRGVSTRHLYAGGFGLNIVALALITLRAPWTYALWAVYGIGAAVNVLGFALLGQGFSRGLAARANTTFNLLMFSGSFAVQWGIGLVVDAARSQLGVDTSAALRLAFMLVLVVEFLAYGWFVFGWRRYAVAVPAAEAVA
jgi:predicted MFS family arabinose efflux permease